MFSAGGAGASILQDLVNQQNPDMSSTSAEELSRYKEEKPIDEDVAMPRSSQKDEDEEEEEAPANVNRKLDYEEPADGPYYMNLRVYSGSK